MSGPRCLAGAGDPEIRGSVKYCIGNWQDERVLAERGELLQLLCRTLVLQSADHLVTRDGGERELLILLQIGRGLLGEVRILLLQHFGQHVGVEQRERHAGDHLDGRDKSLRCRMTSSTSAICSSVRPS